MQITNITDKLKLEYKRVFYAQGTEVLYREKSSVLMTYMFASTTTAELINQWSVKMSP